MPHVVNMFCVVFSSFFLFIIRVYQNCWIINELDMLTPQGWGNKSLPVLIVTKD